MGVQGLLEFDPSLRITATECCEELKKHELRVVASRTTAIKRNLEENLIQTASSPLHLNQKRKFSSNLIGNASSPLHVDSEPWHVSNALTPETLATIKQTIWLNSPGALTK